jgi:hypothetical protein
MLKAAVRLISTQGSTGTRLREIVAASDAPRGSLQHDPAPTMTGVDTQARAALAAAQQAWADADADLAAAQSSYEAWSVISAPRPGGLNKPGIR